MCKYINIMIACYSKYFKLRTFKVNRKQQISNCCKLNSKTVVINITSAVCQSVHKKRFVVQLYQQSLSVQKHLIHGRQVNNYTDSFAYKDLELGLTPVPWLSPTLGLWLEKSLLVTSFKRQNSYCRWSYTSKSSALTGTSFLIQAEFVNSTSKTMPAQATLC